MFGIVVRLAVVLTTLALFWLSIQSLQAQSSGYSLRFYGTGRGDIDRVKFALTGPPRPIDVQFDFTLDLWVKLDENKNSSGECKAGGDNWINGNVLIDRDIFDQGDFGDYGVSIYGQRVAFGVNNGSSGNTICGSRALNDGQWHHIALTREEASGQLQIFVDGMLDAQGSGPRGNISYNDDRIADYVNEPFLVLGAEKHDYDPSNFPSFHGWVDELRISSVVRYRSDFARPTQAWVADEATMGLFHFDEGNGTWLGDSSWYQQSQSGTMFVGGPSRGPSWSDDIPFKPANAPTPNFTATEPSIEAGQPTFASQTSVPGLTQTPTNVTVVTPGATSMPAITTTPSPTPLNPTELLQTTTALPERRYMPGVLK